MWRTIIIFKGSEYTFSIYISQYRELYLKRNKIILAIKHWNEQCCINSFVSFVKSQIYLSNEICLSICLTTHQDKLFKAEILQLQENTPLAPLQLIASHWIYRLFYWQRNINLPVWDFTCATWRWHIWKCREVSTK